MLNELVLMKRRSRRTRGPAPRTGAGPDQTLGRSGIATHTHTQSTLAQPGLGLKEGLLDESWLEEEEEEEEDAGSSAADSCWARPDIGQEWH